jgi:hypothetical protein
MEVNVRQDKKIVEVWLTRQEAQDSALQESLAPYFAMFKAQKYLVAVFKSGNGDLVSGTAELLRHNLRLQLQEAAIQ